MNKNANFVQAVMLLLSVSLYTIITSEFPFLCMLLMGLFLIVFTERSLSDKDEKLLFVMQIILSVIFVVVLGQLPLFLLFYECRFGKKQWVSICYPMIAYLLYEAVMRRDALPYIICNVVILTLLSAILNFVPTVQRLQVTKKAW